MRPCLIAFSCLAALFLATASAQQPLTTTYYPLKVGNVWKYRATELNNKGRRPAHVEVQVDREQVYDLPIKKDDNGKDIVEKYMGFILKSTSEGKTTFDHVVILKDGISRVSVAGTTITPPLLFFKLASGTKPGASWQCDSQSGTTPIKGTFTLKTDSVTVPAGVFDTYLVSLRDGPPTETRLEIDYWFANKVGIVKQRVKTKSNEMLLELEEFKEK